MARSAMGFGTLNAENTAYARYLCKDFSSRSADGYRMRRCPPGALVSSRVVIKGLAVEYNIQRRILHRRFPQWHGG